MPYPSITAYAEAILISDNFKELVGIKPVMAANGRPHLVSGGFAVVFKMEFEGKFVAVKCFLNEVEDRKTRYTAIAEYLDENPSPYFVPYHYYDQELFIDGEEYPVLVMDWIEGETLGGAVQKLLLRIENLWIKRKLNEITRKMISLFLDLLDLPIAHGDLKYDNIMVTDGELKLIDYDGMYVPALFGQNAIELGSLGFQHPERDPTWFDQHTDDFSILIMTYSQILIMFRATEQEKMRINSQVLQVADLKLESSSVLNLYRYLSNLQFISPAIRTLLLDKHLKLDINSILKLTIQTNIELTNVLFQKYDKIRNEEAKIRHLLYNCKSDESNILEIKLFYEYYIKNNFNEANSIADELIKSQNALGQYIKAEMYYYGQGVNRNISEAVEWYKLAARNGNTSAQNQLGELFNYGSEYIEAFKCYKLAAEQGNANAQYNLSACYYNGIGVTSDKSEAVKWCKIAADQGYDYAQFKLGIYYYHGWSVEKNIFEAIKWFKLAALQGHISAQDRLGFCYKYEIDVANASGEAFKWYKLAAEQGHTTAQYQLGLCFENGEGTKMDKPEAIKWYKLAALQGDSKAKNKIHDLLGE